MVNGDLLTGLLLAVPLLGALAGGLLPGRAALALGRLAATLALGAWWALWQLSDSGGGTGLRLSLLVPFSPAMHLELGGAGMIMTGVVVLVSLAALVAGVSSDEASARRQSVVVLLVESGLLGLAAAQDLFSFIIFWELSLLPIFWLVEAPVDEALIRRMLVTSLATSAFLWLGTAQLVAAAGPPCSASLAELRARLAGDFQGWRLWWFLPAFMFRLAAVPLHTWLGRMLCRLPPAPGMMLLGGVLPLAILGLDKVVLGMAGGQPGPIGSWLLWLGMATVLAGGFSALVQSDLKKLLAYLCLTHGGLLLAASGLEDGRRYLWLAAAALAVSGAGLALFAGLVCRARQSQRLADISGLWRSHPFFSGLSFAAVASLAVIPGTAGFSGALGLLRAMAGEPLAACLAAAGLVICGLVALWAYRFILGGSHLPNLWMAERWPRASQVAILLLLTLLLLLLGVAPGALPGVGSGGIR